MATKINRDILPAIPGEQPQERPVQATIDGVRVFCEFVGREDS